MMGEWICLGCMKRSKKEYKICPSCGFCLTEYLKVKSESSLYPGQKLNDRYLVGRVLGAGGYGITYIAYDESEGMVTAIKEFFPKELVRRQVRGPVDTRVAITGYSSFFNKELDDFYKEAELLLKLNKKPGIVKVFNCFRQNNTAYIVMEYLSGESLKKLVRGRHKLFTEKEIVNLLRPPMEALNLIHQYGLVHRDISMVNLVMDSNNVLTLIDFGAAIERSQGTRNIVYKEKYAPPEQLSSDGDLGPWTDVYAMGVIIYYMATGKYIQPANQRMLQDNYKPVCFQNKKINKSFSDAVGKALELDISKRYSSMADFLFDLAVADKGSWFFRFNIRRSLLL